MSPAMGAAVAAANTAAASRTSTGSLGDDHRGRHLRLEAIDRGGICQVRPAVLGALGEFLRLLAIGRSGEVSDQPGAVGSEPLDGRTLDTEMIFSKRESTISTGS